MKTFSIGFEPQTHDELSYARQVAERYGTDHHEFVVEPRAADVVPLLVHHYNEPFADSSALPTYYLARLTRQHVTVALSGDGGDESFAGYDNYRHVQAWARADALPRAVRGAVAAPLALALDRLPYHDGVARASRALQMLAASPPGRHRLRGTILKDAEKRRVYTPEFRGLLAAEPAAGVALEAEPWSDGMDALDWMMSHDRRSYLPDCLMTKVDVASMAVSLEVRCPLLDHPLVEFAARIPSAWKQDRRGGKVIFKRAVAGLLPAAVLTRPKMGFGVPIAHWFRTDLAGLLRETLLDDRARRRNLFEAAFVRRMVEDHVAGRLDWSSRLWALLCLELWFREFID